MPGKKAETKAEETVESVEVKIAKPRWRRMDVEIVGISTLGMDRYAKPEDPDADDAGPTTTKVQGEIERCLHMLPEPVAKMKYGMPAGAFKQCIVDASRWSKYKATELRGALFVIPTIGEYVAIWEKGYRIWTRHVGLGPGKGSVKKSSPVFDEWGATIRVDYMDNFIPREDVLSLISIAGYSVGIGIWSPRCKSSGPMGRFVATGVQDVKMVGEAA